MSVALESKIYNVEGRDLEMYTLGGLSARLGYQAQTVRKWEIKGIIPPAVYRDANNRRLYTDKQIRAVVKCARKHNIRAGVAFTQEFIDELHEKFQDATKRDFD